ncbi:hypothetical protein HS3_00541 [Bacillus subtilis]|nr:hypothetical protein HS3_00541 [Bacillus subtilis]
MGKAPVDLLPITIIPYLKQKGVPLKCQIYAKFILIREFL